MNLYFKRLLALTLLVAAQAPVRADIHDRIEYKTNRILRDVDIINNLVIDDIALDEEILEVVNEINDTVNCIKNSVCNKQSAVPCVDVTGPLRVEYNQFGVPTIIGTPNAGPAHGPGSYFYQVGYMQGAQEAKARFANLVFGYLLNAGRVAEFLGVGQVATDTQQRRRTYTDPQWQQQITDQTLDGTIPLDILDYVDGRNQSYLDHIIKIENGIEPLPADFLGDVGIVPGVGALRWWWADRNDPIRGAQTLFTRINVVRGLLTTSYGNALDSSPLSQVANLNALATAVATAGGGSAIQQVFNDVYGFPGVNTRFTVAEGDRCGVYCPSVSSDSSPSCCCVRSEFASDIQDVPLRTEELDPVAQQTLQDILAYLAEHPTSEDEQPHGSDFLIIGSKLTKNKSALMFGNSQLQFGFNPTGIPFSGLLSFISPRATFIGTIDGLAATNSGSDYTVHYSLETPANTMADGIWEDTSNLVLLWDGVNPENVPGGQALSTIQVRNTVTGALLAPTIITIYQGTVRKGLETNNRSGASVFINRKPITWMKDAGYFLRGSAGIFGMIPFSNLDEFKDAVSTGLTQMFGGLDTDGNIFTLESGFFQAPNVLINRLLPGDATAAGTFSTLAGRALPYVSDANYIRVEGGLVKNPDCGFITGWNNVWANDEQTRAGRSFALQRVFSIFVDLQKTIQEEGKLEFQDVRDMWGDLTYRIDGQNVVSSGLNYSANPFTLIRTELLAALQAQGLAVGLTQAEINRTVLLLSDWDGRSIPATDQTDILAGLNYDGRHVLSSIWMSFIANNLFIAAFPAGPLRTAAQNLSILNLARLTPTANWTTSSPATSRVNPIGVGSAGTPGNTFISVFDLGCNLGNPKQYPWLTTAGLTTPAAIQTFYAQALKDALTNQVTGSNAGTGLNTGPGGRADLNLIQNDGIPLHEGWGKNQRPTTLLLQSNVNATAFLNTAFAVQPPTPILNNQGNLKYVERDCKGDLIHNQVFSQMGWSNLLTSTVINNVNVITVEPHATDMNWYFRGNFETDEVPMDICS